jgi:hypothetical protein
MRPKRHRLAACMPELLFAGIALAGLLAITGAYWALLVE